MLSETCAGSQEVFCLSVGLRGLALVSVSNELLDRSFSTGLSAGACSYSEFVVEYILAGAIGTSEDPLLLKGADLSLVLSTLLARVPSQHTFTLLTLSFWMSLMFFGLIEVPLALIALWASPTISPKIFGTLLPLDFWSLCRRPGEGSLRTSWRLLVGVGGDILLRMLMS